MASNLQAKFETACAFVEPFLQPACVQLLHRKDPDLATVESALKDAFSSLTHQERHVSTASEFASLTRTIFSESYLQHFVECAKQFDKISGFDESVSDVFLQCEPVSLWITKIANSMAAAAEQFANMSLESLEQAHGESSSAATSQTQSFVPGGDTPVAANDLDSDTGIERSPPPECPIIDIHLSGTTIREAWNNNTVTKLMEAEACAPVRRDPTWNPGHFLRLPVYHGTTGPVTSVDGQHMDNIFANILSNLDIAPVILRGSVSPNQVVPKVPQLPVAWTGFSPLRCFLWSSFGSEVISNIPGPTVRNRLQRSWHCRRRPPVLPHNHSGVLLLKFNPQLSSNATYVMPSRIADIWHAFINQEREAFGQTAAFSQSTASIWSRLSQFHEQQDGAPWPDILHCHETSPQIAMLSRYTKQLWRTVWYGDGIAALNASYESVMSISLTITERPKMPQGTITGKASDKDFTERKL